MDLKEYLSPKILYSTGICKKNCELLSSLQGWEKLLLDIKRLFSQLWSSVSLKLYQDRKQESAFVFSGRYTKFHISRDEWQKYQSEQQGEVPVCMCAQLCLTLCDRLQPTRLLCPWDFPGKNTGVGCHFQLQGQNPYLMGILHWQADSLPLSHMVSPRMGPLISLI